MIVRGSRIEESQEDRILHPGRARRRGPGGRALLLALLATPLAADTAVVPTDFATIQAAVDAVQGTPDALVRIDSSATFDGRVVATQSVRIEAGAGFSPTLRGATGHCVLAGPCTLELHPAAGAQSFALTGLRFVPPAGLASGSGGRHVLLFNDSGQPATLDVVDVELVDPGGASYDGLVSRVSVAAPTANLVNVMSSRFETRGAAEHTASAIELGERGFLSLIDSDFSHRGPSGAVLQLQGEQSSFVLASRFEVEAPTQPFHAALAQLIGTGNSIFSDNRVEFSGGGAGTVGGVFVAAQNGGEQSLLFDSNRLRGDGSPGAAGVDVSPFPGSLVVLVAVNNEMRGVPEGFLLSSQGGTLEATLANNTVHDAVGNGVQIVAFGGGAVQCAIFNNLLTRTVGWGIGVDLAGGTVSCELGSNGYFENVGGAIDPLLAPGSSGDRFADPRYVGEDDLRLLSGSPMIDAAWDSAPELPKDDIDGVDRPVGGGFDIGAHEGGVETSVLEVPALDRIGALLLAAALAAIAMRRLRAALAVRGVESRFSAGG